MEGIWEDRRRENRSLGFSALFPLFISSVYGLGSERLSSWKRQNLATPLGIAVSWYLPSEVLDNHKSVLTSFGIHANSEELDLPYIYWIPKMHKNPYKHRFITGSSKCLTKPLSILLTKLLTHIKQCLQKYCETAYSRSGVNQMWILNHSKE